MDKNGAAAMKCNQAHGVTNAKDTVCQTQYAAVVLHMGNMSICCKQSVALGNLSIPRASSMPTGDYVADKRVPPVQ